MVNPRNLILGTAGHIDHGKTALVRALTGVDTDRLPEERRRGITIDVGFAALELGLRRVALIDVPGHERFVRNMIAGASGLDLAMLVVAANDSIMPQTREHLDILSLLDLAGGVIVLTKCDLVDPPWQDLVEEEVRSAVSGTFLQNAEVIRTSVRTGYGIAALKEGLHRVCDSVPSRAESGAFRMSIDRSFAVSGHGTVVTGSIISGAVAVDDELEWLPNGKLVSVRSIQQHDRGVDRLGRGARGALNIAGVHRSEIKRGHELATPGYLTPSRVLSVEVKPARTSSLSLRHRARYRLHIGTAEVGATLSLLESSTLASGSKELGQLFLSEEVVAVHGQPFLLRAESPAATLGGGLVIQPVARRIRQRDTASVARLRGLTDLRARTRVAAALCFAGLTPWTDRSLARDSGVPEIEISQALRELSAAGSLITMAMGPKRSTRVAAVAISDLEVRVLRTVKRLHSASPRHASVVRAGIVSALADVGNDALVDAVIDRLSAAGEIVADGRSAALPQHGPRLTAAERVLKGDIAAWVRASGVSPSGPKDWVAIADSHSGIVTDLVELLLDEGRLVEIGPHLYLDREVTDGVHRRVIEHLSDGSRMTMADLRDLLDTTRRHAVPIGEYLDRIGLTVREGDGRRLGSRTITDSKVTAARGPLL